MQVIKAVKRLPFSKLVTLYPVMESGSIVNMGIKNANGDICYIIGLLKSIREKLGKSEGDEIEVTVCER